jgi:hypothetical protein
MTDRAKFEQMLELLINEDRAKAEELFHELVVAKSREIYESLLDDDVQVEDEESEDEEVEESYFSVTEIGGDETDDFMGDIGADDMGGEEGDDFGGSMDDMDDMGGEEGDDFDMGEGDDEALTKGEFHDAIDELKAEFEAMLNGLGLDQDGDGDHDSDDHEEEDEGEEDESEDDDFGFGGEEESDDDEQEESYVREYVEKVGRDWDKSNDMRSEKNSPNTRSIVAGKNDMGGTAANIARGGSEQGVEANKGQLKGSSLVKQQPQDLKTGNVNVPGSKTATKLSSVAKGHGAEKKGQESGVHAKGPISGKVR